MLSFVGRRLVVIVVGHPRPSLSGTGVPWVSCLKSLVCHRVQDDPVAKSQPVVVLVGVLMWCDSRVRGRGRETRSCATEKTCNSSQQEALVQKAANRTHSQSSLSFHSYHLHHSLQHFCWFWVLCPARHLVEDFIEHFIACCMQSRNPSCSRKCKSVSLSED